MRIYIIAERVLFMAYDFQKIYQGLNYSKELSFADKVGLCLSFVGIFFIQISASLALCIFYGALFSFVFSGTWQEKWEKLLISCSYKSARSMMILLLLFFIGIFYSTAGYKHGLLEFLSLFAQCIGFYLLLPLFHHKKWRLYAEYVFFAGVFFTVFSLLLWPYISHYMYGSYFVKWQVTSMQFSVILALAAYMCFCNYFKATKWVRIMYIVLAIIFMITLFFINIERTGMLIFAVLMLYFIANKTTKKYKLPGICMVLLGLIVVLAISSTWQKNISHKYYQVAALFHHHHVYQLNHASQAKHNRLQYLKDAFIVVKKNPIWGRGTGQFIQYKHFGISSTSDELAAAENSYFDITLQLGIVGLLAFLWFIFTVWREAESLPLADKHKLQGIVLCLFVSSFFYPFFGDWRFTSLLAFFMAIYLAARYQHHS